MPKSNQIFVAKILTENLAFSAASNRASVNKKMWRNLITPTMRDSLRIRHPNPEGSFLNRFSSLKKINALLKLVPKQTLPRLKVSA
jgi:hypothetical protein